jgi:tRNA-uridine 2-sulfurtransferase
VGVKVLAAMSGGVDSAVAAARAKDAGHEVVGVHLALSRMPGTLRTGSRGCCTIEDSMDARRVADALGIPFYVWDFSERFAEDVVADFIDEYREGRTPNPCMRCNQHIKFQAVLERGLALGFDAVATGHYAAIVEGPHGRELHRAAAWAKDQSYVLGVLTSEQLRHCYFPLADTPSKEQVRAEATARGFVVATKPDSHDICFIPDGDTRGWLGERVGVTPGPVIDSSGVEVGTHQGAHAYTVGQRKGLQLGFPAADGKPRYVLEVRPKTNEVIVGAKEELAISQLAGRQMSFAGADPVVSGYAEAISDAAGFGCGDFACHVQVRAHADPVEATARVEGGELIVTVAEPLLGVAPGQSAVIYVGERVVGQCTIDRTVSAVRAGSVSNA